MMKNMFYYKMIFKFNIVYIIDREVYKMGIYWGDLGEKCNVYNVNFVNSFKEIEN